LFEADPTPPPPPRVLTVSQLNARARELVERHMPLLWVAGEISNWKRYDSGHCYFTLKDEAAQVDCVMFRTKAALIGWQPTNGAQVEVRACPTLYEARGKFQLNVETMRRAGLGALYERYELLKRKLAQEGLFDAAAKRELPRHPRAIGIVTSPQAAALRDVLTTLKRRMPSIPIVIYPTPVQGEGAAARIARTLAKADARAEVDVLIVCRGGGSIEDLWAYNDEALARTIHACAIPVISGVGHETDFTIADFVADVRAPTPTAAAELVCPDRAELCRALEQRYVRISRLVTRGLENRMQKLDYLSKCLVHPGDRIRNQRQHLTHLANRLCGAWKRCAEGQVWTLRGLARELRASRPDVDACERHRADLARRLRESARVRIDGLSSRLSAIESHLTHLNPELVLERGYSIATTAAGAIVHDASQVKTGETLKVTFARGSADTEVTRTR
jgi:exodeoxyribonuclease VII large subunit